MYRNSVKTALILVYLVILAGAVVRMTGSGMGCPDWPKCFGHWIPPTERSQLEWKPKQNFHEGQVIIRNESLQVAVSDFVSEEKFQPENWQTYTKHDYAKFNPAHTWTEYINRLIGALAGLAVFVMAVLSLKNWKSKKRIVWLSWGSVFLMGFQGWLGAVVVYSVLEPVKITLHMLMALVIVAVLLYLLFVSKEKKAREKRQKTKDKRRENREKRIENRENRIGNSGQVLASKNKNLEIIKSPRFRNLLVLAVIFTLIQIALGTQVRQFVDEQIDLFGYVSKNRWLASPDFMFYAHRTFSILVFFVNGLLWWKNRDAKLGFSLINWVLVLLVLEIFIGISMYYFDFPYLSRPLHLLLATAIFSLQFYVLLRSSVAVSSHSLQ